MNRCLVTPDQILMQLSVGRDDPSVVWKMSPMWRKPSPNRLILMPQGSVETTER